MITIFVRLLRRLKSKFTFNPPVHYQLLLQRKKLRAPEKPLSDRHVVMMTGRNFLCLTRLAVFAIARNWDTLPKLTIVNDGSLSDDEINKTLDFWKGQLRVATWRESNTYHQNKNRKFLCEFAEQHPFGKKMAIILHHAEYWPVLWVDSDILFYKEPGHHLPQLSTDFICGAASDWMRAYEDKVLKVLPDDGLDKMQSMNAGLLYVYGKNLYEKFNVEHILEQLHGDYRHFTEQTIFAYIAGKSLGILWDQTVVKNTGEDSAKQFWVPIPRGQIARHYTSIMRQMFWRDAMFHLYFK